MYAVIFKAKTKSLDDEYFTTANLLRQLAMEKYRCIEFNSASENDYEIAVSYWHNMDDIKRWKQDPEHLQAQARGRDEWYVSYSVQIVEVIREYHQLENS